LFQLLSGAHWTHVPFKGAAPAAIGVMSGEVDFSFGSTLALAQPATIGKVRARNVPGARRIAQLPEVPTIAESGIPGYITGYKLKDDYGRYGTKASDSELPQPFDGTRHCPIRGAWTGCGS
jgi:hypothetical protein